MARAVWDDIGEKKYELGVDRGMLFPMVANTYSTGVPWNGLTGVTESPSGAEANKNYADNIEYANILSAEEFKGTVEAFTYPDEFKPCDGYVEIADGVTIGQQNRAKFGFSYRTKVGNDTEGQDHGYKIHIIYGAQASPSERSYSTINDSPELTSLSWEISTTPIPVPGHKPTATLVFDSNVVSAAKMKQIEDILYGTDGTSETDTGTEPRLPLPAEIIQIMGAAEVQG